MSLLLIALSPDEVSEPQLAQVRALAQGRRVVVTNRSEEIEPLLDDVEIAVAAFPVALLARAPRLRWFQTWGAGTDWLMQYPALADAEFTLTNASGVHAINISEHILALMLAFSRRIHRAVREQQAHRWERDMGAFELAGQTMLLVGVGAIGRHTARIAAALGMHVIGVRRRADRAVPGIERMAGPDEMLALLPEADWLVLTVPHTRESRHMIDRAALESMKPGAHIINIGRGATIDEQALIDALRSGRIAGAGLDVFQTEPLPEDSPLWDMENVIITAHYSGETPHYHERAWAIFIDNLTRYAAGQPLRNVVDKHRGY